MLSRKEKSSIIGTETGTLKRNRREKMLKAVILKLENEKVPVTQANVANIAGVSIRTVKKYWHAIKKSTPNELQIPSRESEQKTDRRNRDK